MISLVLVVLAVTTQVWAQTCTDLGSAACLQSVRQVLADENRFWFGNAYAQSCGGPLQYTPACSSNNDKVHKSIVTRARNSNNSDVTGITQVLNVTFDVPAGSYEACGKVYQEPAVLLTLDPTVTSNISLWSADHPPHVTWRSEVNKTYTVIVWDAGAIILHGLMFNIAGGSLEQAEIAWKFRGPKNPQDRDQPYVFLLYEQRNQRMDPVFVRDILIASLNANMFIAPTTLTNALSLGEPVGASILTVRTSPYAAEYMKQNRIVNNCPAMLTSKFQSLPLSYNVSSSQLMTSVDVTFKNPDIMLSNVCCHDMLIAANSRVPDPMSDGLIEPAFACHPPMVNLVPSNFFDTYYYLKFQLTLLMIDVTDELAGVSNPDTCLMWQVVNIRQGSVTAGVTTQPYLNPLPKSGRVVMFLLLKQAASIQNLANLTRFTAGESCPERLKNRCRFDLNTFIREHGMSVEGSTWFTTAPDLFSRRQLIKAGLQTENDACQNVPGYTSPCLRDLCTGGSEVAAQAQLWFVALASFVVMAVLRM